MKKLLAFSLVVLLSVSLFACAAPTPAATEAPAADTPAPAAATPAPADTAPESATPEAPASFSADVFIYDYSDTYIASVRDAMQNGFASAGVTANFFDGASDQANQTNQIETAVTKGTSLLIVNIVTTGSEEAAMNIVNLAKDKGIPLVFFNREVSNDVVNAYDKCVFVGTDADEAGYMQGEMIVDLVKGNYDAIDLNGDGKIQYIMFKGELGNAEADGRTKYSVEEANRLFSEAGLAGLEYYDPSNTDMFQPCNWSSAESQVAMATALGTNPFAGKNPIEMVIANNDDMALGAIEALKELGYNKGNAEPRIPVVGVDATAVAQEAITAGEMDGSIKQDAQGMAEGIVYLAKNVSDGKDVKADIDGKFNVDPGVAKIRIPYAKFVG